MTLLIVVFATMLILIFSIVAVVMRPGTDEVALNRRLATLVSPHEMPAASTGLLLLRPATHSGAFGWSEHLFADFRVFKAIRILIRQAGVSISVSGLIITCCGVGILACLLTYAVTSSLTVATGIGAGLAYCPVIRLQMRRRRRVAAFDAALPDAIELCARSLRAGHSLIGAIGNVGEEGPEPVKTEFAEVFHLQNFGLPLRDGLTQLMERIPSADLRVVVTGIMVQKDTGGNLAEIMDHITNVIRERVRIKGDIQVHTAQGRLTGWILCLLPVVLMVAINLMNPGYSTLLFHDPTGQKFLSAGAVLLIVGGLMIRHIINGIEV